MRSLVGFAERGAAFLATLWLAVASAAAGGADDAAIAKWKTAVLQMKNFTRYTDGEDMAWRMAPYLRGIALMAEALEGDRQCLDMFCKAFDPTIAKMSARYRTPEYIAGIADQWRGIVEVPKYLLEKRRAAAGK